MSYSDTDSTSSSDTESLSFKPFRAALYAMDLEIAESVKSLKKLSNDHEDLYTTLKLGEKLQPWLTKWQQEGCLGPSGSWVLLSAEDSLALGLVEGKVSIYNVFLALIKKP